MRSKNAARARRMQLEGARRGAKSRRGKAAAKPLTLAPLRRAHHALPEINYRRLWP